MNLTKIDVVSKLGIHNRDQVAWRHHRYDDVLQVTRHVCICIYSICSYIDIDMHDGAWRETPCTLSSGVASVGNIFYYINIFIYSYALFWKKMVVLVGQSQAHVILYFYLLHACFVLVAQCYYVAFDMFV